MAEYLVRECPDHGITFASDYVTAARAQIVARDCQEWHAQDPREHALDHRADGTDCYACCARMRVAYGGERTRADHWQ